MSSYDIGLSGLSAAQSAFDIIGNNIANAATDGYHLQRIELTSAYVSQSGATSFVGGVEVDGVTRMIDTMLENEILRQQSSLAAATQQASVLSTIETSFGEFSSESGLSTAIDDFFTSMRDLCSYPDDSIYQNQLVNDAQTMTSQFRTIGEYLSSLDSQVYFQAENTTNSINALVEQIAELNIKIEEIEVVGGQTNSMQDQRDQYISELSELVGIQIVERDNGVKDISTGGIPLVTGGTYNEVEIGYDANNRLGLSIKDAENFTSYIDGGSMGGLLELKNNIIADILEEMDTLANAIMQEMNALQVMGVGSAGSFTELTSDPISDLSELDGVTSGEFYIRLTNTDTGETTRQMITIDPTTDTVNDIATTISTITGLTASVNASDQLTITSDPDYEFDFLPCVLPEPTTVDFDAASPPTVEISGIYSGGVNDTFTCTVIGDGAVGNDTLDLEIRDSDGELLRTVNIGEGYAAGDTIELGNGIIIAVGIGDLAQTDGDSFSIDAFATSDTANFLVSAGFNTLFSGNSAETMTVSTEILDDPQRIATALGADITDNYNITRMANIEDTTLTALDGMTCGEYYRAIVTNIGQELSTTELNQENLEVMVLNLENQRDDISGVDINNESAKLLVFEQMYQSMAQYISIVKESLDSLMNLV